MLCAPGYKLSISEIIALNPGVQKEPLKAEKNQVIFKGRSKHQKNF